MHNLLCSSLLSKNMKIKVYGTIILFVILYGWETWSLTLREDRRLRVFENMVLRNIFGSKGDEVTGEWRKPHNEELNDLNTSPNIIRVIKSRRMRWAGHVAPMGKRREAYRFRRWKLRKRDNLEDPGVDGRIILRWIFGKCNGGMDWFDLAYNRDRWRARGNEIMNFRFPAFVLISQVSHLTLKMQCLVRVSTTLMPTV